MWHREHTEHAIFCSADQKLSEGKIFSLALALCLKVLLVIGLFWQPSTSSYAQTPIQVGLVVQYASGSVETKCVTLTSPDPSGWDVLVAASVNVVGASSGMGMTVCAIGSVGCPASDCWCKFTSGENLYWSYWHLRGNRWEYSNLGASNYKVKAGEVEGWIWGDGRTAPPRYTYDEICAPSPTATSTFTPLPTATFTLTSLPSSTFTSTSVSNASPTPRSITATPLFSPTPAVTTMPAPTATLFFSPTPAATTLLAPTATTPAGTPLQIPSRTPSPTITLPFGVLLAATTQAPSQVDPSASEINPTELSFDLQSIALTATAAEANRQVEQNEGMDQLDQNFSMQSWGMNGLNLAYISFFAIVGGLLVLLLVISRRRGAS